MCWAMMAACISRSNGTKAASGHERRSSSAKTDDRFWGAKRTMDLRQSFTFHIRVTKRSATSRQDGDMFRVASWKSDPRRFQALIAQRNGRKQSCFERRHCRIAGQKAGRQRGTGPANLS
jgi:hypothetical protein